MIYLVVKAAHIVAIVAWMGGMLATALAIGATRDSPPSELARLAASLHKWDRRLTTPAMLLAWAFGLALAKLGAWFPAPWLLGKIVFVIALTGLHGVQSGTLRRIATNAETGTAVRCFNALWIVAAVATIVVLVVLKPA